MSKTTKSSLLERIKKTSTIKEADVLSESKLFKSTKEDLVPTSVKAINLALSGSFDGGLTAGHTVIAGPSRHFKSNIALLLASAYMEKYPDAILMFYDSEFGSPQSYFKSFNIDMERVFHTPVTNIEKLKFDIMAQLEAIERGDKIIIVIDSIGNLASKKEVEDAIKQNTAADMSRAKAIKGLFRMVTPELALKNIPLITIQHVYQEIGLFPKTIISGGTGILLSANTAWVVGRRQNKVGTEVQGYHFIINVEKSRFIREKSQIPVSVNFDDGINTYSGLLDIAVAFGYVKKPKQGWYQPYDVEKDTPLSQKMYREKETNTSEFWDNIFENTKFAEVVSNHYKLGGSSQLINFEGAEPIATDDVRI